MNHGRSLRLQRSPFAIAACLSACLVSTSRTSGLDAAEPLPADPIPTNDLPLHGDTRVHLATVAEGRRRISQPDRFTATLSPTDLAYRLQTSEPKTADDLLKFAAEQVRPFSPSEAERLAGVVARSRDRLAPFALPLPEIVTLIKTTGREEGGAAYCRGSAIVFPSGVLNRPVDRLDRLFLHELFHILSSHNPQLRRDLYAIIGFRPCPEFRLPDTLRDRRLTNPDGPTHEYCIEVETPAGPRTVVPVLYARQPFDPDQKEKTFFDVLEFRLLVVGEPDAACPLADTAESQSAEPDGEANSPPLLLDPAATPSYHDQIGRNTGYIIHPDEILAENFVALVLGEEVPDPEIQRKMAKEIKEVGGRR